MPTLTICATCTGLSGVSARSSFSAHRNLVARVDVALELGFAAGQQIAALAGLGVDGEPQQVLDQVLHPLRVLHPAAVSRSSTKAALGRVQGADIDDRHEHEHDDADRARSAGGS